MCCTGAIGTSTGSFALFPSLSGCWPHPLRTLRLALASPPPTHYLLQLLADNAINSWQPDLDPATHRPASATGPLATFAGLAPLDAWPAWDAAVPPGPAVPPGTLTNAVPADMAGQARSAQRNAPGALLPPPA